MRIFKYRTVVLCLATLALVTSFGGAVRAADSVELARQVPSDCWGFAVIRSLDNLDKKAAMIGERFGLPVPPLKQQLVTMIPIEQELDSAAPIAVVAMDMQKFGDKAVAFIVPAKDSKALLEKLAAAGPPPEAAEGDASDSGDGKSGSKDAKSPKSDKDGAKSAEGVKQIAIFGEPMYAAVKGKAVIVSPNEDCVVKVMRSEKTLGASLAEARANAISKSDVYISISAGAILNAYKEMIMGFVPMLAGGMGGDVKTFEDILTTLRQIQALDISITLDDRGLALAFLLSANPDSDLEKVMTDTKNATDSLVGWLPKENYLVAAGGTGSHSPHADKLGGSNALSSILKAAMAQGFDEKATKAIIEDVDALAKSMGRFAFCASALPEGPGGMVGLAFIVETNNASKFVETARRIYTNIWSISDDEDFDKIKQTFAHKPDAETVDGRKIDTITCDPSKLGEDVPADKLQVIEKVLGKDVTIRFGPVDDKRVVVAFGGGPSRYKTLATSVKSGGSMSSDAGITGVQANLASPRSFELYFAVDTICQTFKKIATATGEENGIPFDMPRVDAPIAVASALQGKVTRTDFFVPMKLMTTVKEIVEKQQGAANDFDEEEEGSEGKDGKDGKHTDKKSDDSSDEESGDDN